jgi:uncharacterized protein
MATGPLEAPVAELRRRTGNRRVLRQVVGADVLEGPLDVAGTHVPADAEIELDVVLESVLEGVTVTGTVRAPWRAECRRCLEPVRGVLEVTVKELFEAVPTEDETYPLGDGLIDLAPLVRDAVLLGLPLSAVCDEECVGPDPQRFPAHVEADPDPGDAATAAAVDEPPGDPRWAALADLRFGEDPPPGT